jgi:hypothetical protein
MSRDDLLRILMSLIHVLGVEDDLFELLKRRKEKRMDRMSSF